MTHFGVVAPALFSHYSATAVLAQALVLRGHRVSFFHQVDAKRFLPDGNLSFVPLGQDTHPVGTLDAQLERAAHPGTLWGLQGIIKDMAGTTDMLCRHLPDALARHGVEAMLCDQMEAAGGLSAEFLGLPFASIACALPVNREDTLPLPVMPFAYATTPQARQRYASSTKVYDFLMRPLGRVIGTHAARFNLPARTALHECLSPVLQISQSTASFDFPRLPDAGFHAVGPFRSGRVPILARPAPWLAESTPDRPFIFASLGTMQGHRFSVFQRIARACQGLDAQLLIAHCGGLDERQCASLLTQGATWVTDFADQHAVIERADLVITHAGLNTVMDAIAARTPMVALPLAFDQPGVAARIAYAGIGRKASARWQTVTGLRQMIRTLLTDGTSKLALDRLALDLKAAGGVMHAADLIETHLAVTRTSPPGTHASSRQPVAESAA